MLRNCSPHGAKRNAGLSARADRKSTRLNSSHSQISYAVFCLKKKKEAHVTSENRAHRQRSNLARLADGVLWPGLSLRAARGIVTRQPAASSSMLVRTTAQLSR